MKTSAKWFKWGAISLWAFLFLFCATWVGFFLQTDKVESFPLYLICGETQPQNKCVYSYEEGQKLEYCSCGDEKPNWLLTQLAKIDTPTSSALRFFFVGS